MRIKNINGHRIELPDKVPVAGYLNIYLNDAKTGKLKSVDNIKNLITYNGKCAIADRLRGATTNDRGTITYCAVGTDSTAPSSSNTQLGAEIERKLIAVREISESASNAAVFTTFYTTSEANGTLREVALFGDDASETANSGTMYTHAAINRVKTSADTLTIEYTVLIG